MALDLNQAENEVALRVRQLYFGLLIARLKLDAAKDGVRASEVKNRESIDAVANGRALDIAALESRAAVLDSQQTALTQSLQIHDLTLSLDDLLGLPLSTQLQLDPDISGMAMPLPDREECIRIAREQSPSIRSAQQMVLKAKAGLGAAQNAYIPDITGLARYSYQSGVPLLVHNFGTFGVNLSYDLFDGGRRGAEIRIARMLLSQAQLNLDKAQDEVDVALESAYDKVERLRSLVHVASEALSVRNRSRAAGRPAGRTEGGPGLDTFRGPRKGYIGPSLSAGSDPWPVARTGRPQKDHRTDATLDSRTYFEVRAAI